MAFSEKVKKEVRERAHFRCVVCHKTFVEIHHILPQADGGGDDIENAVPLCAYCHDLYGNNPDKRKQIREMRDNWYEIIRRRYEVDSDYDYGMCVNSDYKKGIAIYHIVYKDEDFSTSARIIFNLLKNAQKRYPGQKRHLYVDIEGHINCGGGYDVDMLELQKDFLCGYLSKYFTELHLPLINCRNRENQDNSISAEWELGIN